MLKDNIIEFYGLKTQKKQIEVKSGKLNSSIKDEMKNLKIKEFKEDGYTADFTIQKRNSLNSDMLLDKLKELNLTGAIKTIEIPDEQKIEDMIYKGELDPEILSNCTSVKEVEVLKVTYKPDKKKK